MKRVPEPELMTERRQVEAYGNADFEEPHSNFINLLKKYCSETADLRTVLDLGSGAGDIVLRFAKEYPNSFIDAVEGSSAMVNFADDLLNSYPLVRGRIKLINSLVQDFSSSTDYELIMSNSLLHHMHYPSHLWDKIRELSHPGTHVFIMDLMRPASIKEAEEFVRIYAAQEPEVLKRDFYNSLLAAYTIDEVKVQIAEARLCNLEERQVSDRHFIVFGHKPE